MEIAPNVVSQSMSFHQTEGLRRNQVQIFWKFIEKYCILIIQTRCIVRVDEFREIPRSFSMHNNKNLKITNSFCFVLTAV